jgi:hypothetical protein
MGDLGEEWSTTTPDLVHVLDPSTHNLSILLKNLLVIWEVPIACPNLIDGVIIIPALCKILSKLRELWEWLVVHKRIDLSNAA